MKAVVPEQTPNEREIIISRRFSAPRDLVFLAWTDARHISQWWGPSGFHSEDCSIDFRVGGTFQLQLRAPDGQSYPCRGVFLEIVPPEKIVYRGIGDDGPGCGAGLPPRAVVTVTFVEQLSGTLLTIHTQLETTEDRESAVQSGFIPGWTQCLERLAESLPISAPPEPD